MLRKKEIELKKFTQLPVTKQERIITASLTEFASQGYAAASLNRVVARAGIAKGSLFNYFKSKEGLFTYLYKMALEQIKNYLRQVRQDTEQEDIFRQLEGLFHAGAKFTRNHQLLSRIYFRVLHTADAPYHAKLLSDLHSESLRFREELLAAGVERGEIHAGVDLKQAAFMLESVLNRFLQTQYLVESATDPEADDRYNEQKQEQWVANLIMLFRSGLAKS